MCSYVHVFSHLRVSWRTWHTHVWKLKPEVRGWCLTRGWPVQRLPEDGGSYMNPHLMWWRDSAGRISFTLVTCTRIIWGLFLIHQNMGTRFKWAGQMMIWFTFIWTCPCVFSATPRWNYLLRGGRIFPFMLETPHGRCSGKTNLEQNEIETGSDQQVAFVLL